REAMIGKVLYGTLAAAILTLPAVATAQRDRGIVAISAPGTRGGFFISGGLGAGAEQFKFSDEEDYSETLTKPTLTLRLGGTPSEQVRLGVEVFGWMAETEEGDESFGAVLG